MTPFGSLLAGLEHPFDHEVVLLEAGLRRLVKREFVDAADLDALERRGFRVAVIDETYGLHTTSPDVRIGGGTAQTALIGAVDAVEEALELERLERHGAGRGRAVAVEGLGALLGYPPCCIAAYRDQAVQTETASFERLLAGGERDDLPPENNLFVLSHQLISHFPCSLSCQASAGVGRAALDLLRARDPRHAGALETLLRAPITVWDRFRILVEHPRAGLLTAERLTHDRRLLTHTGYLAFRNRLPETPPGGLRLVFGGAAGASLPVTH